MSRLGERLNGLRWRLRASRRLWSAGASPEMSFLAPEPPQETSRGELEQPFSHGDEVLRVKGWTTFKSGPTSSVEIWLGERSMGRARTGLPRPDIEEVTDMPYAGVSGFELTVGVGEAALAGATVRAVASGAQGERLELPVMTVEQAVIKPASRAQEAPAPVPESPAAEGPGVRTLVVTHQLTLGGAQLYLMDLLRGLEEVEAIQPTVVAAVDGPLRPRLEAKGIPVHVTNLAPAGDLNAHLGRAEEMAAWVRPRDFELVLINTATSGVVVAGEVAAMLGLPAIWAIHESFEPPLLWAELDREVRSRIEETLGKAAGLVFEADATARIFAPLIDSSRSHVLPYGLDLTSIDAARAGFDATAARREAGVPEGAKLIVCIGTVEERKAQIPLAQAFETIASRHPQAHLAFVGGRANSPYTIILERLIAASPHRERMRLIPITPDVDPWYGMADLLVCASDVESLPRTVLEAMAWETPVLATSVFGLPELIDDGETGWLCEPRDLVDLARGLEVALDTPQETCGRIARQGRVLVEQRHSLPRYAEQMSKLFGEAVKAGNSDRRFASE